ncbi:potassium transporter TrkG [Xinfangfangia sp. CPCC 101601]|uniref:Potassium transporter TrkG n=1 Tax=Pseudogemmobacter lacusdianii TaxID=3069608 RepID=A0ABU0VUN3_9RHOB|nr:potassium transporter TrkG [Xinfangfangia sp. CPCC 101601]MDQ2065437.1 potassium transporter TrkG [Xinfangfangia sp. CPCC 101601]
MRRLLQLPLIVLLLGITALANWVPALHAAMLKDAPTAQAFFYAGLLLLVLSVMLGLATASWQPRNLARSHLATLAGAYLVLPVVMALPFLQILPDTSFTNAWFEMLSSFTTTGATGYAPDRLPESLHLWRAIAGWMGGFFILLAAYAILAPLNLGGTEVISGRLPDRGTSGAPYTRIYDPSDRIARHVGQIFPVYAGLTLALWLGLYLAGETALTALVHAMGTLSTSGISAAGGPESNPALLLDEALILGFMVFAITRRAVPFVGLIDRSQPLHRDPELRTALLLTSAVPLVLLLHHALVAAAAPDEISMIAGIAATFWGALFTAVSFLTTTGYESAHWGQAQAWSGLQAPGMMLLGLSILGGGIATTAGGVKLLRVYALLRHGERELERLIHPSSIGGSGPSARKLRGEGAYMAWVFFMLFAMSIAAVVLALSMAGIDFQSGLVLAIAALTTTGQLADVAQIQPIAYGPLSPTVKLILGVAMIIGRLETLALIALFAPQGWRR